MKNTVYFDWNFFKSKPGCRTDEVLAGERAVLELLALGNPLPDVLTALISVIESQANGMKCSVLVLDESETQLKFGAAPSLPPDYNKKIDGLRIGPQAGSCGTSAYRKTPVIVTDITRDPLWESYRELAKLYGFRACWSVPVLSREGHVLGTFAMYYHEARSPSPLEWQLIQNATRIAAVVLEHTRTRNTLEKALAKIQEQAFQLYEAVHLRDDFLSIASHELKTPLTSLTMQVQLLNHLVQEGTLALLPKEKTSRILSISQQQLDRFALLINDLLDSTRMGAGRLILHPETFDLNELIAEVIHRFTLESDKCGCPIKMEFHSPIVGCWDRCRIDQVIVNILSNAFKYGSCNPIEISAELDGSFAKIKIRDHGRGIKREDAERIFDRFERVAVSKEVGGLGLGLYITRQIVEAHSGKIWAESKIGEGSTFVVKLPLPPPSNSLR